MYDPDIDDFDEALSVVDMYEWAIGNDIGIHTRWNVVNSTKLNNLTHVINFYRYFKSFISYCIKYLRQIRLSILYVIKMYQTQPTITSEIWKIIFSSPDPKAQRELFPSLDVIRYLFTF